MRLQEVDLEAGTVYSRDMAKTLPRTLKMKPIQIMLFYRCIHEIRPITISEGIGQLILDIRWKAIRMADINYLMETFRDLFPNRKLNA